MTEHFHLLLYKNPKQDTKQEINTDIVQNIHVYSFLHGTVAEEIWSYIKNCDSSLPCFFFFSNCKSICSLCRPVLMETTGGSEGLWALVVDSSVSRSWGIPSSAPDCTNQQNWWRKGNKQTKTFHCSARRNKISCFTQIFKISHQDDKLCYSTDMTIKCSWSVYTTRWR